MKMCEEEENSKTATAAGTAAYSQRFTRLTYQLLGKSDLLTSQAGFGCYRVDARVDDHRHALTHALQNGINLIDTSTNYGDGHSEKLVGEVVEALITAGELARAEVIIVSKVGYLQGENYAMSQQRKREERPFPDLVEYSNGLEHCIHPEFIADQLTRSLERLQLETIDCYLLHNPEYYLGWVKKFDFDLEDARQEYYARIEKAFRHLEEEVAAGRIASYGISSNSFPNSPTDYQFTSLETVWEIAERISANHHFKVIQLPMNLLETGGATVQNQSNGRTVLEFAAQKGLGVLINRPLNAIQGHNLVRLASMESVEEIEAASLREIEIEGVQAAVDGLAEIEAELQKEIFETALPFRTKQEFAATLASARLLKERWVGFGSLSNWQDVRDGYIRPRGQMGIQFLRQRPESSAVMHELGDAYEAQMEQVLHLITGYYQVAAVETASKILHDTHQAERDWQAATLSQTAVRALRSTAGISCVLVGMRQAAYVNDVLADLQVDVTQRERSAAWQKMQQLTL